MRSLKGLHALWSPPRRRPGLLALRVLFLLACAVLGSALGLALRIATFPAGDAASADAAIVLGAAVWGERLSPVFEERVRHALDLFRSGRVRMIVFTGGRGPGESLGEAEAARAAALRQGVPDSSIAIETVSRTTLENLCEARKVLERRGLRRVLLVSDPLHLCRAMAMARDLGLDARPAPTPTTRYRTWRAKAAFLLREWYFLGKYELCRRLGRGEA